MIPRRAFTRIPTGTPLAWLGDLALFSRLRPVSAAEARLAAQSVRFHAGIEQVKRLPAALQT